MSNAAKFKIISIQKLSEASGISYSKIYNNLREQYASLTDNEKAEICNALYSELKPFSKIMGMKITIERTKSPGS